MDENKSVITGEFDRTGRYDAGLKSLAGSLRAAFLILLLAIIGTLIYFFSGAGYFSVEPQQAVIVQRFGKVVDVCTSGGHWYLPYPVNQFIRIQTSQQLLDVNFNATPGMPDEPNISLEPGRDEYLMTGDANIVHSSWTIAYRIANPARYYEVLLTPLFPLENGKITPDDVFVDADGMEGSRGPQTFLKNLFRRAVINVTAETQVNDILYAGQSAYSDAVQKEFTRLINESDCGIVIDNVGLNRTNPPLKTKAAFDEVTAAGNTRSKLYNEAVAYKVEVENETLSGVEAVRAEALTYKKRIIAKVGAEKIYFEKIREQFLIHPATVPMALYTAALTDIGRELKGDKFLLGSQGEKKQLWLKLNPELKKSSGEQEKSGEEK